MHDVQGPSVRLYALASAIKTPAMGQIAPLPCRYLGKGDDTGVNPDTKSGQMELVSTANAIV